MSNGSVSAKPSSSRASDLFARLPPIVSASGAYYSAHALLVVAGLISMPIMTRLLSKAEYGLLGLIYATVSVLAVVGGMGFGEAAVRLYGEHKGRSPATLRDLCDSLVGGALAASGTIALLVASIATTLSRDDATPYLSCLPLASFLIIIRAVSSVLFQIHRAQERAIMHASTQVFIRYGTMIVAISFLLLFQRDAYTVIVAAVGVELTSVVARLLDLQRRGVLSRPKLVPPVLAAAAAYGLPLALAGSAQFLLAYADRFLIQHLLGLDAVATYSVPYDIAAKLGDAVSTPAQLAAVPIIFRLWVTEGRAGASRFASDVLTYIVAFIVPIATLYLIYSESIIQVLASTKYAGAGQLTPYILPGVLLGSLNFIFTVGLTLLKRTVTLALLVIGAALLNTVLNLLLIPPYGLFGAAVATTTSYAALLAANYSVAGAEIELRVRYTVVFRAVVATIPPVALLYGLDLIEARSLFDLGSSLVLGTTTATVIFLVLDNRVRQVAVDWLRSERS